MINPIICIFRECLSDPTESITQRIQEMGEKFCAHYVQVSYNGKHDLNVQLDMPEECAWIMK